VTEPARRRRQVVGPGRRRGVLTRERIVEAAIAVIDERGLDGLTMRNLGRALGKDAMAVYGHFVDKADLLGAVVEAEAARLQRIPPMEVSDPVEVLVALAAHYRSVLLDHPNLAPLVASRPLPQEDAPAILSLAVAMLRSVGLDDADIPMATDALTGFLLGYIVHEASQAHRRAQLGDEFRQQQERVRGRLRELPHDTSLEQAVIERRLSEHGSAEDFEAGLRAMLHGFRLGLAQPLSTSR
jgi:TetR/AcrR family transcriptional regulator, tetracycline repressor protein